MTFHVSNFGDFGRGFRCDLHGQVATTTAEVMGLCWPYEMDEDRASEIAAENEAAMTQAEIDLADWRSYCR